MSIKEHPPQLESSDGAPVHVPVLLDKVLEVLNPKEGESYLDLTAGYGGHARAVIDKTKNFSSVGLVDRDEFAADQVLDLIRLGAQQFRTDFVQAAQTLLDEGKTFDMILADLGVSSPQLDREERGFSFRQAGPLDMRMDSRQDLTAEQVVNTYSREELAKIIERYGEEPRSRARVIASAITEHRPLSTTLELAELVKSISPRYSKKHPATRTFQALRIEVNQELGLIEELLPMLPRLLNKGGRVAIISFHSLEDRLIKRFFKNQDEAGYEAELESITKKPIDGKTYDVYNPRSRSAKLRSAVKK